MKMPRMCSIEEIPDLIQVDKFSRIVILTDTNVARYWLDQFKKNLNHPTVFDIIIPAGEHHKNIENAQKIWASLQKNKINKSDLLICLGGGMITDIGGFCASVFMRGLPFLYIPTSLLGQVDASIGEKTAINFGGIKNQIGTFSDPLEILTIPETLKTLPKRDFISGFSEIIKHGLIADKNYLEFASSKGPQDFSPQELSQIIVRSIEIKSSIVSQDPQDEGIRKILNFGHTIGHALEILCDDLLHGEAVAIGIIAESKISEILGKISSEDFELIKNTVAKMKLPTICKCEISVDDVLEKITFDKKTKGQEIKWTLLEKIGKGIIDQDVKESVVRESILLVIKD